MRLPQHKKQAAAVAYVSMLTAYVWDYFHTFTLDNDHATMPEWKMERQVRYCFRQTFHLMARAAGKAWQEPTGKVDRLRGGGTWKWDLDVRWRGPLANAYRKGRGLPVYVYGLERMGAAAGHRWHVHALSYWPRYFNHTIDYGLMNQAWGMGYCRHERPRSQGDVASYVAKYVAKEGEVGFSASFASDRLARAATVAV